jgi:pimeloyl-ACP methyl ester carboxylesterase
MIDTTHIEANGYTFTLDVSGAQNEAPVIALHGFPQSRHSWHDLLGVLAEKGFRSFAPDQRGYSPGARPTGIEHYDTKHLVSDVLAIADALDIERFHLVGHDWGGQVAWLTAASHPERLRSLTVLSRPHPAAFAEALRDDPVQASKSRHHKAFQDPAMATRLLSDDAKAIRDTLIYENAAGLFGIESADSLRQKRRMSDQMVADHLSVLGSEAAMDAALNWYRAAFAGGSTLARADIAAVTVPTLYMWGCEDMAVGAIAAAATPRYVTGDCKFEAIDGAGHFLAEEVPQRIATALLAHLAAN